MIRHLDCNLSLAFAYPSLFAIAKDKEASTFTQYYIIDGVRKWNIQFNRMIDIPLIPTFVDLMCFLNTY